MDGIFAHGFEVRANAGESGFFRVDALDLTYPFQRLFALDVATQGVHRVGGINDDASILQTVNDLFDEARLRILGMNFDSDAHVAKLVNKSRMPALPAREV